MSDGSHLLIPYAASGDPGCRQTLESLSLPHLERLLARLAPQEVAGDGHDFSMPHERVLARECGVPAPDGLLPFAAWELRGAGRDPGNDAFAWVTPCHWRVGTDHIFMLHPQQLQLDAEDSQALLAAMQPYFEQDGMRLSYEAPTRWLADVAVPVPSRTHAVQRSRELCAMSLGYAMPAPLRWGLRAQPVREGERPCVAFVHGTSRDDKCWPQQHWARTGRRLVEEGFAIALPHGSDAEQRRSVALAEAIGSHAFVWPRLDLGALTDRLAGCAGVIGVDSGLSHIAVALGLPHVQVYNFDTAWRTGPIGDGPHRSVYGSPCPPPEAVWEAWQAVRPR